MKTRGQIENLREGFRRRTAIIGKSNHNPQEQSPLLLRAAARHHPTGGTFGTQTSGKSSTGFFEGTDGGTGKNRV